MFWSQHLGYWGQNTSRIQNKEIYATLCLQERQIAIIEKDEILQLEGNIAHAFNRPITTEATSKLVGQLCKFEPQGRCRVLPRHALDDMVKFSTEMEKWKNGEVGLGIALCKSRNPDFLRKVMTQSGVGRAMKWLAPLVSKVPATLNVLPTQALAELYFCGGVAEGAKQDGIMPRNSRCRSALVQKLWSDDVDVVEVIRFFAAKLHASSSVARKAARHAFASLVTSQRASKDEPPASKDESSASNDESGPTGKWLLDDVTSLPSFGKWADLLCTEVGKAINVATDLHALRYYIRFVGTYTPPQRLQSVLSDISVRCLSYHALSYHALPLFPGWTMRTPPLCPHAPKAVTYHEQSHYFRFMIGHSLGRMDLSYFLTTFPFI